jgi:hypothetical protein
MQTTANVIKHLSAACRAAAVLVGAVLVARWLWAIAADAGRALAAGVPVRTDEALTAVVALAGLAGIGWLVLGVVLELLAGLPGGVGTVARRVTGIVTPHLLRRAAGAVLGVGLVAGALPGASLAAGVRTAHAEPAPLPDPGFAPVPDRGSASVPDPRSTALPDPGWAPATPPATPAVGWLPEPPVVRVQPDVRVLSPAPPAARDRDAPAEQVVRRGDSLWSIAARHLGHGASDGEIAQAWPAWFEANRTVIGNDPDLLRPGQLLRAPDGVRR